MHLTVDFEFMAIAFRFLLQILSIYDSLNEIDLEAVAMYVSGLQQPDGSFFGDKWGEVDTRFSFCAVAILSLIVRNICQ